MKRFKKVVTEGSGRLSGGPTADAANNLNMQDYSNPAVVRALNSFVGTVCEKHIFPEQAIGVLRNSLSKIPMKSNVSFDAKLKKTTSMDIINMVKKLGIIAFIVPNLRLFNDEE